MLLKEEDYMYFLDQVKNQDNQLYDISLKFSDITKEAKKILDSLKDKSDTRQEQYGSKEDKIENHHKTLPREIKEKLLVTAKEVDTLHLSFDKFTLQTQSAIMTLHESGEHISKLRKEASISAQDDDPNSLGGTSTVNNLFTKIKDKKKDIKDGMQVFGDRGQGIY